VFDYNILCDKYATPQQYGYTPAKALSWDYRKQVLLSEIQGMDADFVSLQEIDQNSYDEWFRPELANNRYKGVFYARTRSRTMPEQQARFVDGCATFFKSEKYILLDKALVDFANMAINRPDMKGEHDIFNRVMPRDNIAIVCFFENRMTGSRIIVANAHIYWDPVYEDVKLVQVAILMEQISKLASKWASVPPVLEKNAFKYTEQDNDDDPDTELPAPVEPGPSQEYASGTQIPLVMCGDFNAGRGASIYDLITTGSVPSDHADLENRSYGDFTKYGMQHGFSLKSAYAGDANTGDYMDFTNYTPGFSGVLDYIWHSNSLKVKQILGNIDFDYLQTVPGFPNYHFPSDHLPLYAEFAVEAKKERPKTQEADFGEQQRRGRRP
jgi:CCR4-NOT transcription complex subunit 6